QVSYSRSRAMVQIQRPESRPRNGDIPTVSRCGRSRTILMRLRLGRHQDANAPAPHRPSVACTEDGAKERKTTRLTAWQVSAERRSGLGVHPGHQLAQPLADLLDRVV